MCVCLIFVRLLNKTFFSYLSFDDVRWINSSQCILYFKSIAVIWQKAEASYLKTPLYCNFIANRTNNITSRGDRSHMVQVMSNMNYIEAEKWKTLTKGWWLGLPPRERLTTLYIVYNIQGGDLDRGWNIFTFLWTERGPIGITPYLLNKKKANGFLLLT